MVAYKWVSSDLDRRIRTVYILILTLVCILSVAICVLDLWSAFMAEWSMVESPFSPNVSVFNNIAILAELVLLDFSFSVHFYSLLQQTIVKFGPNRTE